VPLQLRSHWASYDAVGAQASANLYSLVMTCRANDVEPYAYLNYLFEHLPAASTMEQVEALLPWNVKAVLDEQKKKQNQQQSAA
jgi:transposase